ncbi:sigma-70 family RNA polymerase sigma factor [Streptomyces spiramenti]|uniref:Sigma-70 family RNA polymerase sigma factor n=1 Tax=Streptomyces spiramenti TaxID=2720606 RepID=A0ABX1ASN6_9ACTN|nr:sigma-70 family RNA polymerase sigma factor [Streptomyces spiramenti]NJP67427.1 sigma-70 family RNA polymerase sigma factor [Streptomyces spiramenti]
MRTPPTTAAAEVRLHDAFDHRSRLVQYVQRLTGDRHRAEDIAQEALFRFWRLSPDAAPSDAHLAPWLYRVARNLAVDAHRRDRAVPMGEFPPELVLRPDETDVAESVATRQAVARALAGLSPDHRRAVAAVMLCDLSCADAARELGVPPGTVKSRVHYAVRALRRELVVSDDDHPTRPVAARRAAGRPTHRAPEKNAA